VTLFDPEPLRPDGPTVRVRLLVAYDGTGFHGYAENPGVRTVAGTLREAVERVLGHAVELTGAGRTDRGVHAYGQVVSFDARSNGFDHVALARSLNKLVRPAIAVRDLAVVDDDFDARFSATSRVYRYRVLNTPVHDPFRARFAWHVPQPIDLAALRLSALAVVGEHDFAAFCRKPAPLPDGREPSLRRTVHRAEWRQLPDGLLELEIEANAFCHNMVRALTGTMVEMGMGRRRAGEMLGILRARDRSLAGRVAPPEGLTLWEVRYDGTRHDGHDAAPAGVRTPATSTGTRSDGRVRPAGGHEQ
jgi:tRNA pseudouridine38-40 synthase